MPAKETTKAQAALEDSPTAPPQRYRYEVGLPMLLSLLVPGLGQFYDGRRRSGCLWLLVTLVGYVPFILPGVLLHLLTVLTAGFRRVDG